MTHVGYLILRELTKILRKDIRDPRLSDITITAVECTNDLDRKSTRLNSSH